MINEKMILALKRIKTDLDDMAREIQFNYDNTVAQTSLHDELLATMLKVNGMANLVSVSPLTPLDQQYHYPTYTEKRPLNHR